MKKPVLLFFAAAFCSAQGFADNQKSWLATISDAWNQSEELRSNLYEAAQLVPEIVLASGQPIAVHGNYCGPNHGDPSYTQHPIDAFDAACMNHDMCYDPKIGGLTQSCACDYLFVDELTRNVRALSKLDFKIQGKAAVAAGVFSFSACKCRTPSGRVITLKAPSLEDKGHCL